MNESERKWSPRSSFDYESQSAEPKTEVSALLSSERIHTVNHFPANTGSTIMDNSYVQQQTRETPVIVHIPSYQQQQDSAPSPNSSTCSSTRSRSTASAGQPESNDNSGGDGNGKEEERDGQQLGSVPTSVLRNPLEQAYSNADFSVSMAQENFHLNNFAVEPNYAHLQPIGSNAYQPPFHASLLEYPGSFIGLGPNTAGIYGEDPAPFQLAYSAQNAPSPSSALNVAAAQYSNGFAWHNGPQNSGDNRTSYYYPYPPTPPMTSPNQFGSLLQMSRSPNSRYAQEGLLSTVTSNGTNWPNGNFSDGVHNFNGYPSGTQYQSVLQTAAAGLAIPFNTQAQIGNYNTSHIIMSIQAELCWLQASLEIQWLHRWISCRTEQVAANVSTADHLSMHLIGTEMLAVISSVAGVGCSIRLILDLNGFHKSPAKPNR